MTIRLLLGYLPGATKSLEVFYNVYECQDCGKCFTQDIDFKHPLARITHRAAQWICALIKEGYSIKSVAALTGICWETIKRIHKDYLDLITRYKELMYKSGEYKPIHLGVDEFAIHKGHDYATCVLDLDSGEVLWVGKGRTIEDFKKFFEEMPEGFLSNVKAFAMDMNAAYNKVVSDYLPALHGMCRF